MEKQNRLVRSGDNVKSIIQGFANSNKINPLTLDYALVGFKSYIIKDDGERSEVSNLNDYIDTNRKIIQSYELEIFRRESSFYPILIQVQTNDNATELKALIYTQRIPPHGDLEEIITKTILNICAYRGIIINLAWDNFAQKIAEVALKLRSNDNKPEFYTIDIARLKEPLIKSHATRLLISKNKTTAILSHDSLLLSGGFFRVNADEILLSYKKPIYASPWRNIYGNLYGLGLSYPIGIEAGEGVLASVEGDKIIYRASCDGFVSIVGGVMQISQSIVIDNINSKNLANIRDSGIQSLVVKNDALLKDAIPNGINLKIENLKVIGNIGAVELESQNLFINGQVHIKSNLIAQNAQILHLKGKLVAKNAEIRHCDNANLECENLSINYLNGTRAYFNIARISHIQSNNFLFIQKSAVIKSMIGENNEFILYPCLFGEAKAHLEKLNEKLFYIKKLRNLIAQDSAKIRAQSDSSELVYQNLLSKKLTSHSLWQNILDSHKIRVDSAKSVESKYNDLMANLAQKESEIKSDIRAKQEEMFAIEVIFEEKVVVGFFVRFINFYGTEFRYHINANENKPIKRVLLGRKDENINILCYKD